MLSAFFRMLGKNKTARNDSEQQAFAQLNAIAPIAAPATDSGSAADGPPRSIVCRETLLNRQQRVAGYEFRLNRARRKQIHHNTDSTHRLYDEILLRNILTNNIERLLGHRLAFIPLSVYSLNNPLLEQLPQHNTVLVLECSPECTADFRQFAVSILPRLSELQQKGFRIGLTRYVDLAEMQPFLNVAEYMLLDVEQLPFDDVQEQIRLIQQETSGKQLVARGIDSLEMQQACMKLPFSHFHGSFIMRREQWDAEHIGSSPLHIMKLLNLLRQKAEHSVLAAELKHDPALTYRLLRFINSPASGLNKNISSIEQALMLFGQRPLYRWLTLLLFTSDNRHPLDAALFETALVRARLTELLWLEQAESQQSDELFITGLFSLLDILLQTSLTHILEHIQLSEPITQALLQQQGPYAPYLALAVASESFDSETASNLAASLNISTEQLNRNLVDALIWAQELDETGTETKQA